ncbi:MAG: hypothetical protein KGH87_06585 [Thaumarchaeota archaeon]|nr:hypothetical protein [Nitrososphaerota archaeon]
MVPKEPRMSMKTNSPLPPQYSQTPEQANALNAETNLMNQQTGMLGQEQSITRAAMPFMFSAMGFSPQFDSSGNLTSLGNAMPAWMRRQGDIQSGLEGRVQNALNGGVQIDPYLKQQLDLEQQAQKQSMYNTYGTNPMGSTGGQNAESLRSQNYLNTLEDARRGDLTMAENLSLQNEGGMAGTIGMMTSPAQSIASNMHSSQIPGATMGQIYGQGFNQQQLGMQYGQMHNQAVNNFWGDIGGGVGGAGGALAMLKMAGMF